LRALILKRVATGNERAIMRKIAFDGLWRNNQALVALLGLCPLLAVSNSVVNSLGLGLATTVAMVLSNALISMARDLIAKEVRLPIFVMVIAANVTIIDLLMQAYFQELHRTLGIFVPLIVTNCAIVGRAEAFASKNDVLRSAADGLFMGLGFALALIALGALRESIGQGTLLAGADALFGDIAANWKIQLFDDYGGFLLAILPPGAFIGLGLLVAFKNAINTRMEKSREGQGQ
jgi:electron transport complex protein RnfE